MSEKRGPEKRLSQKSLSQKALSQKALSQKSLSQKTMSRNGMSQKALSQNTMSQNTISQKTLSQKTISQMSQNTEPQKSKSQHKKAKSKSNSNDNACCAVLVCDPSPEALEYAAKKAHMRANMPTHETYKPWLKKYHSHRKAIEEVKPAVDCTDPIVVKDNYSQLKRYNIQGDAFHKLEKENAILARRIANIFVSGSLIDDRHDPNIPTVRRMDNRHQVERERKNMRLIHENVQIFDSIHNAKPVITRKEQLEWYAKMEKFMDLRSVYPLHFKPPPCPAAYQTMVGKNEKDPKQYAYLQVEMEDNQACNLVCELFAKLCPFTARNFQKLCQFSKGECDCRSYRCKTIDKLVSFPRKDGEYERAYWQVGGGVEAMPEVMEHLLKEGSKLKHTKEGYLTRPIGVASGEFYITMSPAPYLDDLCYVFGKVEGPGLSFLKQMAEENIDTQGNPKTVLHITDCGVVGSPDEVPQSMLMKDFILRVQDDIIPLMEKRKQTSKGKKGHHDKNDD